MIPFSDGIRHTSISFGGLNVTNTELQLIKSYIIDTLSLYSSPSTCSSKVKSLKFLFAFLHEKEFKITMISTPVINLFRLWLDETESLTMERKNQIEADLHGFVAFLQAHNLVPPGPIVIPRPRPTKHGEVRRAPDQYTMSRLDTYFSDFSLSVPNAYRCLYFLLRMIPVRNQEAFSMRVDAFSARDGLLEIRIPTFKETANHKAVYNTHYRLADEYPEILLLRSLQEQKAYALKCQRQIEKANHKDRLMVSPRNPKRLVTPHEFNAFLEDVCKEQGITDTYGNPTKITMYSLRMRTVLKWPQLRRLVHKS